MNKYPRKIAKKQPICPIRIGKEPVTLIYLLGVTSVINFGHTIKKIPRHIADISLPNKIAQKSSTSEMSVESMNTVIVIKNAFLRPRSAIEDPIKVPIVYPRGFTDCIKALM